MYIFPGQNLSWSRKQWILMLAWAKLSIYSLSLSLRVHLSFIQPPPPSSLSHLSLVFTLSVSSFSDGVLRYVLTSMAMNNKLNYTQEELEKTFSLQRPERVFLFFSFLSFFFLFFLIILLLKSPRCTLSEYYTTSDIQILNEFLF